MRRLICKFITCKTIDFLEQGKRPQYFVDSQGEKCREIFQRKEYDFSRMMMLRLLLGGYIRPYQFYFYKPQYTRQDWESQMAKIEESNTRYETMTKQAALEKYPEYREKIEEACQPTHPNTPWCPECGATFAYWQDLLKHEQRFHKKKKAKVK